LSETTFLSLSLTLDVDGNRLRCIMLLKGQIDILSKSSQNCLLPLNFENTMRDVVVVFSTNSGSNKCGQSLKSSQTVLDCFLSTILRQIQSGAVVYGKTFNLGNDVWHHQYGKPLGDLEFILKACLPQSIAHK
jgi:hypothetical protein